MTSSTSASRRRWPWAALLVVLLVWSVDRLVFAPGWVWSRLAVDDPDSMAGPMLALETLRRDDSGRPRVAVVGTSRVIDGFDAELAERLLPEAAFAKLGHPRYEPFAIRQLVPRLVDAGVDAVCLVASEQDTHRPLRLEPAPGTGAAHLGALRDLLAVTDWRFAVENRTSLYRVFASSWLYTYRFRRDLQLAGFERWREFDRPERLRHGPSKTRKIEKGPFRPVSLWDARHHPVPPERKRSTWDLFPPGNDPFKDRIQAGTVQEITPGAHVPVQMHLFRRAVQELRGAGVEVVIVEGVMHPAAADLYDTALHGEFLAFAADLVAETGAVFVEVDEMPPFAESDFYDIVHTNRRGMAKITRAMVLGLRETPLFSAPGG